jgi:hypothetical protein
MSEGNGSRPAGWVDFALAKSVPFEQVIEAFGLSEAFDREGDEYKAICPLHGGTKESFGFNVSKGLFHCFGCKKSGNVLDFVNLKLFAGKDLKAAGQWLIALLEPPSVEPTKEEMPALPAADLQDAADAEVLSSRDIAICRGIARYLSSLFSRLGNVETIEQELMRCVAEEISAGTPDA